MPSLLNLNVKIFFEISDFPDNFAYSNLCN